MTKVPLVCIKLKTKGIPSRSLSNVSVVVHSVAGPVPFTVTAVTLNEYSVPGSRPGHTKYRFNKVLLPKKKILGLFLFRNPALLSAQCRVVVSEAR